MGAYKDTRRDPKTGAVTVHWRYQKKSVLHWDGVARTVRGTPDINTRAAALAAEEAHIKSVKQPPRVTVPTLNAWFRGDATDENYNGRFWTEWVIARKNKPTERRSKQSVYEFHLDPVFGHITLDRIGVAEIARFRAQLVATGISTKTINKILCVLSKALRYALDCELIVKVPKLGLFKTERPEIIGWTYEEYARMLAAARAEGDDWYTAVCLAGEAGLRVGEVKALRWREDVDMVARTITINQQTCDGETTTPKGRTRRTVPMTSTLYEALKQMATVREGFVVRDLDGSAKTDGIADKAIARICRCAGLPVRRWHTLRHTFGTHAALFGVNPWRLQGWLGHKRIDETMLYVHVAENHGRELPEVVREASLGVPDPDGRVIAMLGARAKVETLPLAANIPPKRRSPGSPRAHAAVSSSAVSTQAMESARVLVVVTGSEGGYRTLSVHQ